MRENDALRVELQAWNHVLKTRAGGGLTAGQYRMLQQVAHPDNSASKETREKVFRLVDQLRYVLCSEAEPPVMDAKKFSTRAQHAWVDRRRTIQKTKKAKRAKPGRRPAARPRELT